jgi:hypothetical protein
MGLIISYRLNEYVIPGKSWRLITTSVAGGTGQGGNITLIADYLMNSGASVIEASSALSTPGEIEVQAVDVDAGSLQVNAQAAPLNAAQWAHRSLVT